MGAAGTVAALATVELKQRASPRVAPVTVLKIFLDTRNAFSLTVQERFNADLINIHPRSNLRIGIRFSPKRIG
jgi:hypothetical protein